MYSAGDTTNLTVESDQKSELERLQESEETDWRDGTKGGQKGVMFKQGSHSPVITCYLSNPDTICTTINIVV